MKREHLADVATLVAALAIAALSAFLIADASAGDVRRPDLVSVDTPYLCFERAGAGKLSLFGCDDDITADPFLFAAPNEEAQTRLFPHVVYSTQHAASRFALLAGKFMGRVDAATIGSFHFRFKVILK